LDAHFPDEFLSTVLAVLAISPASEADGKHAPVKKIPSDVAKGLKELYEKLSAHSVIKGKFIILPNVSEGGSHTLLRTGFADFYKNMPCVGGYIDGDVSQLGDGNLNIICGLDRNYGNKRIAVFQTSDSRSRPHAKLGQYTTWVKWAEPTAEALRQACLACESRISQAPPFIPPIVITSLHVSNCKFLGPLVLELNPQYNALIGGRGTGKSTILEYLRWGLCDDPSASYADDEDADYRTKRRNLIDKTLVALQSTVQVNFLLNGVEHSVRRNSANGDVMLKIGESDFSECRESDISSLLPIQSYSQKQLSQIGVKIEELNRFVRQGIRQDLEEIGKHLSTLAGNMRAEYSRVLKKRHLQKSLTDTDTEIRSLDERVQKLRAGLKGLEQTDQDIIGLQPIFEEAEQFVNRLTSAIEQIKTALSLVTFPDLDTLELKEHELENLPDRPSIVELAKGVREVIGKAKQHFAAALCEVDRISDPADILCQNLTAWQEKSAKYEAEYQAAKTKSSAHQTTLSQLTAHENRLKKLRASKTALAAEFEALGDPDMTYAVLRQEWAEVYQARAKKLEGQCHRLTELSNGAIRATLRKAALTDDALTKLKGIATGTNIRTNKLESLFEHIRRTDDPIAEWLAALTELEQLACVPKEPASQLPLPRTPILSSAGLTPGDLNRLAGKMTEDSWLDLSLSNLEDQPVFEYRSREAEYIPFADASAGQQATALLWALLNQEGPPLIIDQPEDDLDNQVISTVVEQIWKAKPRRQLIFSSHNANLVVNGDAELVICCAYRITGDQSTGFIKCQGAIDIQEVREEITRVMEGGTQAFNLRREKYGF
jgi:type III restriction enzyme